LLFLVLVLPVVHDPADRRDRRRGDLDQVESLLTGDRQRLRWRHDAQLLSGVVDDPDLAYADALVDAEPVVPATRAVTIECDSGPPLTKTAESPRSARSCWFEPPRWFLDRRSRPCSSSLRAVKSPRIT